MEGQRVCQVIELKKEFEEEYFHIHANIWSSVLAALEKAHIVDYSINFMPVPIYPSSDPDIAGLLIASFKYVGQDFEGDMKAMAANTEVQRWWKITDGYQKSLVKGATGSADGPWWLDVKEVFRFDK